LQNMRIEIEKIINKYPLKPVMIIVNKADKLSTDQRNIISGNFSTLHDKVNDIQFLSAKEQQGIDILTSSLLNLVNTGALRNNETIVTNVRHYDSLLKALEEIQKVKYGLQTNLSAD